METGLKDGVNRRWDGVTDGEKDEQENAEWHVESEASVTETD